MPSHQNVNRLVIVNVAGSQVGQLTQRLARDRFYVTEINSHWGFFYEATVTLLIGLEEKRLPQLLQHIRECCHTRSQFLPAHAEAPFLEVQPVMIEAQVGGATVYVLAVERFEQL